MPLLRTLFSGGCLFDIGAQMAGYAHLDGWEIDPKIAAVAQQNGFDVRVADVCDVDYVPLPFANHLHASPSCKNASQANQKGKDENGELLPRETPQDLAAADAVCRAIAAHQGETFSLENVWGYRTFGSFEKIRVALRDAGFSYDYWHLNSADYGVPQTRKRLILIARRGLCRIQRPSPTHREGGDMFHPPWVGWYAAIEDILHTLPPTKSAPWQMKRLPAELRDGLLIGAGGYAGEIVQRECDDPAFTIAHGGNGNSHPKPSHQPKAYIVGGGNTGDAKISSHARAADEPMFTVRNGQHGSPERALLLSGAMAGGDYLVTRNSDEPAVTVIAADERKMPVRALLIGGQYQNPAGSAERIVQHAHPSSPSWTVTTGAHKDTRAVIEGYWVRMTIQALGRFQTVPDDYIGLTSEINGNGVPCEEAKCIMESLRQ